MVKHARFIICILQSGQVLDMEEGTDVTAVRRQFRRLAQQVHPDKCRCFGAESAFKLISKAASIVSGHADSGTAGAQQIKLCLQVKAQIQLLPRPLRRSLSQ